MGKTWKELQKEIEDYIVEIWLEEPEELSKLHQGKLENCAGSYGQYFSTIDHACGMVRDLGQFTRNYTQTTKRGLLTTNKG